MSIFNEEQRTLAKLTAKMTCVAFVYSL